MLEMEGSAGVTVAMPAEKNEMCVVYASAYRRDLSVRCAVQMSVLI